MKINLNKEEIEIIRDSLLNRLQVCKESAEKMNMALRKDFVESMKKLQIRFIDLSQDEEEQK